MKQRLLQSVGVAVTVVLVSLAMATTSGQTPTAKGPSTKTSWGEPNLQGIWGLEVQVPLERPDKYKNKEFFTDAELAELDKERAAKPSLRSS
jgi:hypothetical protein